MADANRSYHHVEAQPASAIHDEAVAVASFHAFQREIGGQLVFHYRLFSDLRSATSDGRPKRAPMAHPVVSLVSPLSKLSSLPLSAD